MFVRPAAEPLTIWCIPGIINQRLLACCLPALHGQPRRTTTDYRSCIQRCRVRTSRTRGEADAEIVHMKHDDFRRLKVRTELIAAPKIHAVASPAFRARHPVVTQASDFRTSPLIHEASTLYQEQWFENAGVTDLADVARTAPLACPSDDRGRKTGTRRRTRKHRCSSRRTSPQADLPIFSPHPHLSRPRRLLLRR